MIDLPGSARARIIAWFCARHALMPDEAIPFDPLRPAAARAFARLMADRLVREAGSGRYWLDLPALEAREARDRRNRVLIALVSVAVAVPALSLLYRG